MAAASSTLALDVGQGRTLPLLWTRSAQRRTVQLLVRPDGRIEVKSPHKLAWSAIEPFVLSRREWLLQALERMQQRASAHAELQKNLQQDGLTRVSWLGSELPVRTASRTRLCDDALELAGGSDPEVQQLNLQRFMQRSARTYLAGRLAVWSERMAVVPTAFALSSARGRWGSCSSTGAIRLNGRLMQAAPAVIDYVVIHELAHLTELNHSPRFWAIVATHCPDWKRLRDELKVHGSRYMLV